MRVRGDSAQCARAAAELDRAARAVGRGAALLHQLRSAPEVWQGTAATCWAELARRRSVAGEDVALRLTHGARALALHAVALDELQRRAHRLAEEAAQAGLQLTADGWIAPVAPVVDPLLASEAQAQLRRAALRVELLARVAALRAEEQAAHDRLRRSLRALDAAPLRPPVAPLTAGAVAGEPGLWAPTRHDVAPVLVGGAAGGAGGLPGTRVSPGALGAAHKPVVVLRNVPGMAVLGIGYGTWVDTEVHGRSTGEAVVKNVAVTIGGTAVAAGVTAGVAAAAPVAVPVLVVVGVSAIAGAGVAYAGGRIWDAVAPPPGRRETAPARPVPARPAPAQPAPAWPAPTPVRPQVGPVPRPQVGPVHNLAPAPAAGLLGPAPSR